MLNGASEWKLCVQSSDLRAYQNTTIATAIHAVLHTLYTGLKVRTKHNYTMGLTSGLRVLYVCVCDSQSKCKIIEAIPVSVRVCVCIVNAQIVLIPCYGTHTQAE